MKNLLRLLALAGTTIFGVASLTMVVVTIYKYIDIYYSPPPPIFVTQMPGYHRFPIYGINSDLREVAPIIFVFVGCLILYRYSRTLNGQDSK